MTINSNHPAKFRSQKYHDLMPHRVREILLVSNRYDAFVLQEDGHLTEQILMEYKELSLSSSPRVTHAPGPERALEMLGEQHFDLVLGVARLAGSELLDFASQVKSLPKPRPVVVLGFDANEMALLRQMARPGLLDAIFLWHGDAKILLAIIKILEDRANADHDIAEAGVRVILVVEDSIRYTSSFLSVAYPELMKQSQALFSEGQNRLQKLYRMRSRPKILHAVSYEEALALFHKYREVLLAVISDSGFSRAGQDDPEAGIRLLEHIRAQGGNLPVLLHSADRRMAYHARRLSALFVPKIYPQLLQVVRHFFKDYLGFGDFIFRLSNGDEVIRARDIRELIDCLQKVPEESLDFHVRHNHFSTWLMARSEVELARKLHPKQVSDFGSVAAIRSYLVAELEELRRSIRTGVITDFSPLSFDPASMFQRLGEGSLGGKARGIAFLDHLLSSDAADGYLKGLRIAIPQSFVITTEYYERFLEENEIVEAKIEGLKDDEIRRLFLKAHLPETLEGHLAVILRHMRDPLAVRSSSLLEDDMFHSLAGIYTTLMLANDHPEPHERFESLCKAIKIVYASTFSRNARAYLANTGHRSEEEKMAVVIQNVVGQRYGCRFYPHISGVAHSYNYYPLAPLKAEYGVVQLALGLGRMVVDGGECIRFCPRRPGVMPQFANPGQVLRNTQKGFYALALDCSTATSLPGALDKVSLFELADAAEDGTLMFLSSVYDTQNQVISETTEPVGPRVVTFANILKHQAIPLAPALDELLGMTTRAMGTAVEIEFCCDLGDYGRRSIAGPPRPPTLYVLQVRPILGREGQHSVDLGTIEHDRVICRSGHSLGHGGHVPVQDLVYVKPADFDPAKSLEIAQDIGRLNEMMIREKRAYVLIGPGRFGSSDHWLGIPVQWAQISAARIIVEASPEGYNVEPSQGTHFFHNLTSMQLGYLTIPPGQHKGDDPNDEFMDWRWLDAQPAILETQFLRLVRTALPLAIHLDGRNGLGILALGQEAQPGPQPPPMPLDSEDL